MEHSTLPWPPVTMADPADQEVLVGLRAALREIADAHGLDRTEDAEALRAVRAALDGAQLSARAELLLGTRETLRDLIPAFVYLVVLPLSGDAAALRAAGAAALGPGGNGTEALRLHHRPGPGGPGR